MDDAAIIQQYHELRSCRAVAELYGINTESVRRVLIKNGIDRTGWKQQPEYVLPKHNYRYPRLYVPVSYDSVCEYCGKEFVSHDKRTRYCSRKCKDIAIRLRKGIACNPNVEPYHKVCVVCGSLFDTFRKQEVTCSHECAENYRGRDRYGRKQPLQKICNYCGKAYFSKSTANTCGDPECKKAQKRERNRSYRLSKKDKHHVEYESRVCVICGKLFDCDSRLTNKTCSQECSKELEKMNKRRRDKRVPKERRIDNISLRRLYERDKGVCYICGVKCDWNDWRTADSGNQYPGDSYPTIEHVMPVSLGGLDSWDNVRLACWKCNHEKGATVGDLQLMLGDFAKPTPKTGAKKTAQYSLDGELIKIWDSTAAIRRELGLNDTHIQSVCRGYKSNTGNAYGFHWEYVI